MTTLAAPPEARFATPRDGVISGRLVIAGGAAGMTVRVADLGDALVTLHTEGRMPKVEVTGGEVLLDWRGLAVPTLGEMIARGPEVVLTNAVPWSLRIDAAAESRFDLRGLELVSARFSGGTVASELWLPSPHGSVWIGFDDGATRVTIHQPGGVPYRLSATEAAVDVAVHGERIGFASGPLVRESRDFATAVDRLELAVEGPAIEVALSS